MDGAPEETQADVFVAAREQKFDDVVASCQAHPELWTAVDAEGHSLAHWAALTGNLDFVDRCLEHGVAVDLLAEKTHQTALMWAIIRDHIPVAQRLLDAKADAFLQDSVGASTAILAIQHHQYWSLLLLVRHSEANSRNVLELRDQNGCTFAHWAAFKGDATSLRLLGYFGADLLALDSQDMLPLHRAMCSSQAMNVVEYLLEQRSDMNSPNKKGESALSIAMEGGDPSLKRYIDKLLRQKKFELPKSVDEAHGTVIGVESVEERPKAVSAPAKQVKEDRSSHKLFPTFWLVMVSLASFQYLNDIRSLSWEQAPTVAMFFEIGVPLSLALFARTALMNPGRIPPKPRGASGVEELMRALGPEHVGKLPDFNRLCTTTWVYKGLRTKYCTETQACIEEFDHYCIWLNCAIGKNNHRPFVLLAIVEAMTQLCQIYLIWGTSPQLGESDAHIVPFVLNYPLLAMIFVAHICTCPWVCVLVMHQLRLVAINMTTNEMINRYRYSHFWKESQSPGMGSFQNPFHRGVLRNCIGFWWARDRSLMAEAHCAGQCCHHHI
jgi:palmitoyltransferase